MRASDTNGRLIGGSLPTADRSALATYTGYEAYSGNGGCNVKETDGMATQLLKFKKEEMPTQMMVALTLVLENVIDATQKVCFI